MFRTFELMDLTQLLFAEIACSSYHDYYSPLVVLRLLKYCLKSLQTKVHFSYSYLTLVIVLTHCDKHFLGHFGFDFYFEK